MAEADGGCCSTKVYIYNIGDLDFYGWNQQIIEGIVLFWFHFHLLYFLFLTFL
jgi:hypothetical protein